jgi:uncharacterized protein YfaT (DUF1175 family)
MCPWLDGSKDYFLKLEIAKMELQKGERFLWFRAWCEHPRVTSREALKRKDNKWKIQ